jgi:tetratricopeptide (TPR) repeat protein
MPSTDTEIPHFAFTHHRIGIHRENRNTVEQSAASELAPLSDTSWQPKSIQKRNLGLAYLQFSDAPGQAPFAAEYSQLATSILANSDRLQPGDSEVQAALSRLFWNRSVSSTLRYAESASRSSDLSSEAEATIAYTLGTTQFSEGKISEALPWLKRTTELRPTADVWYMLSQCYDQLGDGANALSSARKAVRLAPDRPRFVEHLVNQLRSSGAISEATDLELRLQPLRKYREEMDQPSGGSVDKRP